jgi:hypothetical protein
MVTGIVRNYRKGERGSEVIPHRWFWSSLPGLVYVGCAFSLQYTASHTDGCAACIHRRRHPEIYDALEDVHIAGSATRLLTGKVPITNYSNVVEF